MRHESRLVSPRTAAPKARSSFAVRTLQSKAVLLVMVISRHSLSEIFELKRDSYDSSFTILVFWKVVVVLRGQLIPIPR